MDACESVEKEISKFLTKCEEFQVVTSHRLQESIDQLIGIRHDLEKCKLKLLPLF